MASIVRQKPLRRMPEGLLAGSHPTPTQLAELSHLGVDGCVLDGVLSRVECEACVHAAEEAGFSFWDPEGADEEKRRLRNADTLEFMGEELCSALYERLRPFVAHRVQITDEQPRFEPDLEGAWEALGLNPHVLINRYGEGGHFAPHADGSTQLSFDGRSLYTVLLYLNDCSDGGATLILRDEQTAATTTAEDGAAIARPESVLYAVDPKAGRAVIYWHQTIHAGERVGAGSHKYCLRSDVMYERVPKACVTPQDLEAYELYQRARELEASGATMDALHLFMRCRKLSKTIARAYRL
uniref:Fe2OG dioxygenase domain-containing protein n=1 Tax=Calcidiscus leptoporus TaxID=127549 RepID=A0A7S0J6S5_9EUKA|mmetsp:Transcript_41946/g.98299  ORF Transcript_41946/g.98299 Transcript_41946/m.98299 type:complete len:297 (+) Transcript_41946:62-952(+)